MSKRARLNSSKAYKYRQGDAFSKEMANHFDAKRKRLADLRKRYIAASKVKAP